MDSSTTLLAVVALVGAFLMWLISKAATKERDVLLFDPTNKTKLLLAAREAQRSKRTSDAMRLFKKCAELGSVEACHELALLSESKTEKFKWTLKAAKLGSASAMLSTAAAYRDGEGVLRNMNQHNDWIEKAAEAGDATALAEIGKNMLTGFGRDKDVSEGLAVLFVAEFKGSIEAKELIKEFDPNLSNDLRAKAQARAKEIMDKLSSA